MPTLPAKHHAPWDRHIDAVRAAWPVLPWCHGWRDRALLNAAAADLALAAARPLLQPFVPVGRMALTNYLTHSIVGLVVF
ncbi:DUF418 domain-containing protein [Sphingosinicella sp. LY1275]|uniref:DUF418 domain-containing protein n=1 Tax=Sphingosinicella sp. LY1275 TaxID=3095379 RepID=UPI003A0FDB01